ncbi:MAG: hypothetical protein IT449_19285 [Phycisphaerales bacterium]|nr:hypothetical protein [Phycisphaerales bacterium]
MKRETGHGARHPRADPKTVTPAPAGVQGAAVQANHVCFSGTFVCQCLTRLTLLRFDIPLIEPDGRSSRIRLPDQRIQDLAHEMQGVMQGSRQVPSSL